VEAGALELKLTIPIISSSSYMFLFVGCTSKQLMSGSDNGRLLIECSLVTVYLVSS